ncbi:MAG: gamma-glutamyl-gamma-aminobutyrate hydrolase family protein [Methylococcales bacterium]
MANSLRVGLTMRVIDNQEYIEPRDALAQDWGEFMASVLPEARWIPLPNLGETINEFVLDWNINALILTGGNDIGRGGLRELTERTLLNQAIQHHWPVLGICRGMQFLHTYFKGSLHDCDRRQHRATRHNLHFNHPFDTDFDSESFQYTSVNSFHTKGILASELTDVFQAFALSEDGLVEGMLSLSGTLMGIMWHPEREQDLTAFDQDLLRTFFKKQKYNG